MEVHFYDRVQDELLKFVVIISIHNGKFVFCMHKDRITYEIPGGHREENEGIFEAAKRELCEEIGAKKYDIKPIGVYSVIEKTRVNDSGNECFGMLYFAEIKEFHSELQNEIEEIVLTDQLPTQWTYPLIQPKLMEFAVKQKFIKKELLKQDRVTS